MNEADVLELIIGFGAIVFGLCGLVELYREVKGRMRAPFDWALTCPELRQASHVRLTKKGTWQNDDHGDQASVTQEEWQPFVWAGYIG